MIPYLNKKSKRNAELLPDMWLSKTCYSLYTLALMGLSYRSPQEMGCATTTLNVLKKDVRIKHFPSLEDPQVNYGADTAYRGPLTEWLYEDYAPAIFDEYKLRFGKEFFLRPHVEAIYSSFVRPFMPPRFLTFNSNLTRNRLLSHELPDYAMVDIKLKKFVPSNTNTLNIRQSWLRYLNHYLTTNPLDVETLYTNREVPDLEQTPNNQRPRDNPEYTVAGTSGF
jgi:hypothetical protein